MLNITNDKKKNARKMPISYDLVPMRMGNARHYGAAGEECTHHDFWVTVNRKDEMSYPKVQEYVKKGEKIMNADVVIWHSSACHHEPRSEDGEVRDGSMVGATPVGWSGFDLRPRNSSIGRRIIRIDSSPRLSPVRYGGKRGGHAIFAERGRESVELPIVRAEPSGSALSFLPVVCGLRNAGRAPRFHGIVRHRADRTASMRHDGVGLHD